MTEVKKLQISDFKLALFDLDGTLIKFAKEFLFSQTRAVYEKLSMEEASLETLEDYFSKFDFFGFVEDSRRAEFERVYWELFNWADYPEPEVLPGTLETLSWLKESGVPSVIVTSRDEKPEGIAERLSGTGIENFIVHILSRSDLEKEWHDKRPQIETVCKKFEVEPMECLFAGDVPPDIESAKACGVGLKIALLSGGIRKEVLEVTGPDWCLDSLAQIPQKLSSG